MTEQHPGVIAAERPVTLAEERFKHAADALAGSELRRVEHVRVRRRSGAWSGQGLLLQVTDELGLDDRR